MLERCFVLGTGEVMYVNCLALEYIDALVVLASPCVDKRLVRYCEFSA
jgi:hypothetical protein